MTSITFNKLIKPKMWILAILIWSTSSHSSNIDVGYKEGFALETLFDINDYVYIHTERSGDTFSYGLGAGFRTNYFTSTVVVDRVFKLRDEHIRTEAKFMYNDRAMSYSGAISYAKGRDLGYKIGIGYALSERFSIVTHYSDTGLFIGVRRWIY